MAKKKLFTIKDLLNADFETRRKFSDKTNRQIIQDLKPSALNRWNDYQKKYAKMKQQYGYFPEAQAYRKESPIWRILNDERPLSSLTSGELRNQVKVLKQFFETKTSRFSGWKNTINKFQIKFEREVNRKFGTDLRIQESDYKNFWEIYNRVTEHIKPETLNARYELWREVGEELTDNSMFSDMTDEEWDRIASIIEERINEETEQGKYSDIQRGKNPLIL